MLVHMLQLGAQNGSGGSGMSAFPMLPPTANGPNAGFAGMPLLPGLGNMFDDRSADPASNPFAAFAMDYQNPFGAPQSFLGAFMGGPSSPRGPPAPVFDINQIGGMTIAPPAPTLFQQPVQMNFGYQPPAYGYPGYQEQLPPGSYDSPRYNSNPGMPFSNPAMPNLGMNNPHQAFGYPQGQFMGNMMPQSQPVGGFPGVGAYPYQLQEGNTQNGYNPNRFM
jgi:hypothetical protein